MVSPVAQLYTKGAVPPDTLIEAVPSEPPLQVTSATVDDNDNAAGSLTAKARV